MTFTLCINVQLYPLIYIIITTFTFMAAFIKNFTDCFHYHPYHHHHLSSKLIPHLSQFQSF